MTRHEQTRRRRVAAAVLVAGQGALLTALLLPAGRASSPRRRTIGALTFAGGNAVALVGATSLGPGLTPSPLPSSAARLRTGGVYRFVRHPIYAGLTAAAAGRTLASGARRHCLATVALAALFGVKARLEERALRERFPVYAGYAARTGRWLPRHRRAARCGS